MQSLILQRTLFIFISCEDEENKRRRVAIKKLKPTLQKITKRDDTMSAATKRPSTYNSPSGMKMEMTQLRSEI